MKGFIAAIITLCLLTGGITWNGIWINRTLTDLSDTVEVVEKCEEKQRVQLCSELWKKWKDNRALLSITISHSEIEGIDSKIVSIAAFAKNKEAADFESTLSQLKEELEYLHLSESFTLEGII